MTSILRHETREKVDATMEAMNSLCWHVTTDCNLNCLHCLSGARRLRRELTADEALLVLSNAHGLGVRKVGFSGGEPLLRQDLKQLIDRSVDYGMQVSVTTNGLLLDARWLDFLVARFVKIKISLDGPRSVHDYIRGDGAFDRAVRAVRSAVAASANIEVNCVITSALMPHLQEFYALVDSLKVTRIVFLSFVPRESGALHDHLQIGRSGIDQVLSVGQQYIGHQPSLCSEINDYLSGSGKLVVEPDGELVIRGLIQSDDVCLGTALDSAAFSAALNSSPPDDHVLLVPEPLCSHSFV